MTYEYDPELALWKPGRRKFFLMGLGALGAAVLGLDPVRPILSAENLPTIIILTKPVGGWPAAQNVVFHPDEFTLVAGRYF